MIIAQVCLRLATIKGHSKMCSFITQHNSTDVACFEGACNWHADCRNVHQSCCLWIECSFIYHKPSLQRHFREFGSTFNWPHNRRPRVTTPAQDLHIQHLLSGKNTNSIAGSTQIFIQVSEHKTRPGQKAGSHNWGQRMETGRWDQSNQASSHSTRQRG